MDRAHRAWPPARVVDQHIAGTGREYLDDRALGRGRIRDINGQNLGLAASSANLRAERAERFSIARGENHAMPESSELNSRLTTYTARCAGEKNTSGARTNVHCHTATMAGTRGSRFSYAADQFSQPAITMAGLDARGGGRICRDWLRLLTDQGFKAALVLERTDEARAARHMFIGRCPSSRGHDDDRQRIERERL